MLLQSTTTNACESWHRQLKVSLGMDENHSCAIPNLNHIDAGVLQLLGYSWHGLAHHGVWKRARQTCP